MTAILITTFNQQKLLENLVNSIYHFTNSREYDITILDNSCGKIRPFHLPISVYDEGGLLTAKEVCLYWKHSDENIGNLANNYALDLTDKIYDNIIILNDDVEVKSKDWLQKMLLPLKDKSVGIVGIDISKVRDTGDTFIPDGKAELNEHYAFAESWCIALPLKVFKQVGGFSDEVKIVYGEDFDLSMKIKKAGYKMAKAEDVSIIHLRYGTTRSKDFHLNPDKICADNLKILYKKWRQ